MNEQNIEKILRLIPVNQQHTINDHESWLDNTDETLLDSKKTGQQTDASSSCNHTYHVEQLNIQQQHNEFVLLTDEGNKKLNSGNIIKLANIELHVDISSEEVIIAPAIQFSNQPNINDVEIDDIWQQSSQELGSQTDSLLTSLHSNQPINQDPLSFLYNNQTNNRFQTEQHGLNINTQQSYLPVTSQSGLVDASILDQASQDGKGNILHDLGINEQIHQAKLQRHNTVPQPSSYATQAPIDMLDELLTDNNSESSVAHATQYFDGYSAETTSVTNNTGQRNIFDTVKNVIGRTQK